MNKGSVYRWLRIIHRDLGFFVVGLTFVYAISGICLNHMKGSDPSYKVSKDDIVIAENMSNENLKQLWSEKLNLPEISTIKETSDGALRVRCKGGSGLYTPATGALTYEVYKKRPILFWLNKMHYGRIKGWNVIGDIFAGSLIFFAVSGLFMVKGKNGIAGKGKYYLILGVLIPILYVIFM